MRRSLVGVIALLAVSLAVAAPAAAQSIPKFGYINSQRILAEAPGRAEAEAQFEREVGSYRAQIQRMEDSLRTLAQAFEREQASLTPTVRQQRTTALEARETAFRQRADSLNQQMQRRQAELVRPIMEQLNRVIDAIRSEERYTFIFDVAAQGQPIVAADTTLDITPKVLARLRAIGPPTATSRPATQQQPTGVTRPRQ